jgi:hypothetical protein
LDGKPRLLKREWIATYLNISFSKIFLMILTTLPRLLMGLREEHHFFLTRKGLNAMDESPGGVVL